MLLREFRENRLLSLRDLAEKAGVSYTTIHGIETGKHKPTFQTLRKLAAALGIEPEELAPLRREAE